MNINQIPLPVHAALVKQGKTLEEVRAAKPTADFDERWGKLRRGDQFVEYVYYGYAPYKK